MDDNAGQTSGAAAWLQGLSPWFCRALAVLAGALATLGQAPFQIVPAYVVAITMLVWLLDLAAARRKRLWSGAVTGLLFGAGHFVTGLYWVASAFLVDPKTYGLPMGVLAALALGLGMAWFWMLGGVLAVLIWSRGVRRVAALALAFTATEWLRGHILTGLPWLLPGYVWTAGEPVSQLASVVGIYGLTAFTLLIAGAPALLADNAEGPARRFAPLLAAGLVLGLVWGWGAQRLASAPLDLPGAQPVVRVADSGLSQADKWQDRPDQEWRVLRLYQNASGAPDQSRADILIWPEGAIPVVNFFMLENPGFLNAVGAGLGDRTLVLGLSRREPRGRSMLYFNSAAVIDGVNGVPRLSQVYDKNHLVPFGEYIPLWPLLSRFNLAPLQQIGEGFTPGAAPTRLVVPGAPPAVVLICYESIFPGMTPRGPDRPGWIINVSNDAWFGDLRWFTGPWQAYEMARYRAIEEGLPMARAASGGVSAIVDSFGRAVRETHRAGGYAEAQLPLALPPTPFASWGVNLFSAVIALIAALRWAPAPKSRER